MSYECSIESTLKIRQGKKWKHRYCVMQKLSPSADCVHFEQYKNEKKRKSAKSKQEIVLEGFFGTESSFVLDKENDTLAIICRSTVLILAFENQERLVQWDIWIRNAFGCGCQFNLMVIAAPASTSLTYRQNVRLHLQDGQFCLTTDEPPHLVAEFRLKDIRTYGPVQNKFCFEAGSKTGANAGCYVLLSSQTEKITQSFSYATRKALHNHLSRKLFLPEHVEVTKQNLFNAGIVAKKRGISVLDIDNSSSNNNFSATASMSSDVTDSDNVADSSKIATVSSSRSSPTGSLSDDLMKCPEEYPLSPPNIDLDEVSLSSSTIPRMGKSEDQKAIYLPESLMKRSLRSKNRLKEILQQPISGSYACYDGEPESPLVMLSPLMREDNIVSHSASVVGSERPYRATSSNVAPPIAAVQQSDYFPMYTAMQPNPSPNDYFPMYSSVQQPTYTVCTNSSVLPEPLKRNVLTEPFMKRNVTTDPVIQRNLLPEPLMKQRNIDPLMKRSLINSRAPVSAPPTRVQRHETIFEFPPTKSSTVPQTSSQLNYCELFPTTTYSRFSRDSGGSEPLTFSSKTPKSAFVFPSAPVSPTAVKSTIEYAKIDEVATRAVMKNMTARAVERRERWSSIQTLSDDSGKETKPLKRAFFLPSNLLRRRTSLSSLTGSSNGGNDK